MRGQEIRAFRERMNWSQKHLSDLIREALGSGPSQSKLSEMEQGKRETPEHVSVFLDSLSISEGMGNLDFTTEGEARPQEPPPSTPPEDTVPPPDAREKPTVPISQRNQYTRICTDLWEMVAVGVGGIGAVLGSDSMMVDGRLIDEDKEALGRAYGKLAETNETFRKMLIGATSSGAWLEVCIVTGSTFGKIYRNHASSIYPEFGNGNATSADGQVSAPAPTL